MAAFYVISAILVLSSFCVTEAQKGGFGVELIHRDSPKSPFYNLSESASDRVANSLHRSFTRARRFKPSSVSTKAIDAEIIANSGSYLMHISIGTPAFDIVAIADTGSDLIWTQCKPCSNCFKQDTPLFDPSKSSTYEILSCRASKCQNLDGSSCSTDNSCEYSVSYGDNSFSKGDLAADTLTLASTTGSPVAVPNTIVGCGHDNGGNLDETTSGIIGLGGGEVSLISQLGASIDGKFSYCLLPLSDKGESSKMNFGTDAIVSGSGAISTPLTRKNPDTFYFLTLEGISVVSNKLKFTGSYFGTDDGNIIIDSGTTLTLLPKDFYSQLESAVASQIRATRVQGPLSLCYDATTDFSGLGITMHFKGADVKLSPMNTFVLVSDEVSCFTFAGDDDDIAIYGNLAQMNFLVGYDTERQAVSFRPTDCLTNKNLASSSATHSQAYLLMFNVVNYYLISFLISVVLVCCF